MLVDCEREDEPNPQQCTQHMHKYIYIHSEFAGTNTYLHMCKQIHILQNVCVNVCICMCMFVICAHIWWFSLADSIGCFVCKHV